jgi:Chitinase class I
MARRFDRKTFFDSVRDSLYGGTANAMAEANMNVVLDYWLAHHARRPAAQLAYILATVRHEVGPNMVPVRETFADTDAKARERLAAKPYARPEGEHGHSYYGRGYVQLTWHKNYAKQQEKLGLPLVANPDLALDTAIATRILFEGMLDGDYNPHGHGLGHYVNARKRDFRGARYTVNLQDRADLIAGHARKFLKAIRVARRADGSAAV